MPRPNRIDGFPNLVTLFFTRAEAGGDQPFLWRKTEREWTPLSWREVAHRVSALADSLLEMGLTAGDRVVLDVGSLVWSSLAMVWMERMGCLSRWVW